MPPEWQPGTDESCVAEEEWRRGEERVSSDHLDGLMSSCGVTVGGSSVVGMFSGSASVAPAGVGGVVWRWCPL